MQIKITYWGLSLLCNLQRNTLIIHIKFAYVRKKVYFCIAKVSAKCTIFVR